jgi:aminopeptidase YwaD
VTRTRRILLGGRRATVAIFILALVIPVLAPEYVPGQTAPPSALLQEVTGSRAYEHVVALSQRIGSHVAGTPEDRTTATYIARQLEEDGYAVEWQAFPFPYFSVRSVGLVVPSHSALVLHPHAMIYSPSSPPGGITADLVDAGIGRPDEMRRKPLAGKIALVARGTLPFRDKVVNAAAAGAVATIIYNSRAEAFVGIAGRDVKIPVVSISGADGLQLLDLVRSGTVTVHLNVQTVIETRTTWNIIGTKTGTRDPHRVLVVGGHRDTVETGPGANDNTSGTAVTLEIARALSRVSLAATVQFVLFGAEEEGLYGSDYYAKHMGADRVIGMVNLDMEGVGERLQLAWFQGPDTLVTLAARLAERLGIRTFVARSGGSDHLSFERAGVPVVFLLRPDDPYIHTPKDTADRVDPKLLEASGRLAGAIVLNLAGAGP